MFEDLLSSATEQQKMMDEKLKSIEILRESHDNGVTITINAKKEILDITIKKSYSDNSELEDQLVLTLNEVFAEADVISANETQKLLKNMLPGGFGNLFG
ncbi:MAG: YbaB/EbfC family nucleoid-associated protein [Deltaproteobacteria bacterium]